MGRKNDLTPENDPLDPQAQRLLSALIDRYRYSSLGALVKGIVHNLNGSLQILSMQLEMLQRMLPKEEEKIQEQMEKCFGQIEKFRGMLEVLIQKGIHEDQDTPQTIHLNELLEEELSILQHNLFFKHQVKVHKELSSPLPLLKGSYADFSQGLSNLILNAIEAMEDSSRKELTIMTKAEGNHVRVIIKDTGGGIPEKVKPHLFKPFFSSKGGKHQGVGLYIAREILNPYGASFHYSSQEGETIFEVQFPLQPAPSR